MQWTSDFSNPELHSQLLTDRHTAKHAHFRGTPSFLIGRSTGPMINLEPSSPTNPTLFNKPSKHCLRGSNNEHEVKETLS
jgi:hypothetical protein